MPDRIGSFGGRLTSRRSQTEIQRGLLRELTSAFTGTAVSLLIRLCATIEFEGTSALAANRLPDVRRAYEEIQSRYEEPALTEAIDNLDKA